MNCNLNILKSFVLGIFMVLATTQDVLASFPHKFNYQGVVRTSTGDLQANTTLIARMTIRQGTATGTIVWQEQHTETTNAFGLMNVVVGTGVNTGLGTASTFADIDWTNDLHFLEVEVDFGGGMNNMGVTQLLSVPYALVAEKVLNTGVDTLKLSDLMDVDASGVSNGNVLIWDGTNWVKAGDVNVDNITVTNTVTASYLMSDSLQTDLINTTFIESSFGQFELLSAEIAGIEQLNAEQALIDSSYAEYAFVSSGMIQNLESDSIVASYINVDEIVNNTITSASAIIDNATIDQLTVNNLTATNMNEVDGDVTNELITSVSINSNDSLMIMEGGTTHYLNLASQLDGDATNEQIDDIYMSGNNLVIDENGHLTSMDASSFLEDNTIDSIKLIGNNLMIYPNNGAASITVNLTSISNAGDLDQDLSNELITGVSFTNDSLFIMEANDTYAVSLASLGLPDSIFATFANIHSMEMDSVTIAYANVGILEVGSVDATFTSTGSLESPVATITSLITTNAYIDSVNNAMYINATEIDAEAITAEIIGTEDLIATNVLADTLLTTVLDAVKGSIDTVTSNRVVTNTLAATGITTATIATTGNVTVGDAAGDAMTVNASATFVNTINLNGSAINIGNSSSDVADVDATVSFNSEASFQDYVYHFGDMDNFGLVNNYAKVYYTDSIVSDGPVKFNNTLTVADTMLTVDPGTGELAIKATTTSIGSGGSALTKILKKTVVVDIPNVNPGSGSAVNVTVTGANLGSAVSVSPESDLGNLMIASVRVSSTDNVTIRVYNPSGGAINPASMNFYFLIVE